MPKDKEISIEKILISAIEKSPQIILIIDKEGIVKYINHTVSGLSVKEVVGKNQYDFIPKEYRNSIKKIIDRVFETGEPGKYQTKGTGPNNTIAWYEAYVGPIKENNEVKLIALFTSDITARKKAEQELELKIEELERSNKSMVGRELKMLELKKKILEMERKQK